jgi:hypothetical protein
MSNVAGLVCEGQTDAPILRALLQATWPHLEVRTLQPELDETDRAKGPAGWSEVKAWCERNAAALEEVLNPYVGDPIDLLLIAVDVDIAVQAGIEDPPREVGAYEATRLRETMRAWLRADGRRALPPALVLSTPTMAIEAWIIAALYPREHHPEQIQEPAEWLVGRVLRRSPMDGRPWKELHVYRSLAPRIAANVHRVRQKCGDADRTLREVEQRRHAVERA